MNRFLILTSAVFCSLALNFGAESRALADPFSSLEAKRLFADKKRAARMPTSAYGSYTRGCLAGAVRLPSNGSHWQVMRLSRNRNWGHPGMIDYIERLSSDAARMDSWPGLLVGDISQPRGGPLLSGHRSHQIGLDVDIWFRAAPKAELSLRDRERWSAYSMITNRFELNRDLWTDEHSRLMRRAASYPDVARIFVHPTIKRELCNWSAGAERGWLRKVRPWYGHDDHFHVRLACPRSERSCVDQDRPPSGDGCGDDLAWWFTTEAYRVRPGKGLPGPGLMLADLPAACSAVLESE